MTKTDELTRDLTESLAKLSELLGAAQRAQAVLRERAFGIIVSEAADGFVAQIVEMSDPVKSTPIVRTPTLEEMRAALKERADEVGHKLARLSRSADDDPHVIETWLPLAAAAAVELGRRCRLQAEYVEELMESLGERVVAEAQEAELRRG